MAAREIRRSVPADVTSILSACHPGQTVAVKILRHQNNGKTHRTITLKLKLGYRPI